MKQAIHLLIVLIIFILGMIAGINLERKLHPKSEAISFGIKWEREHPENELKSIWL